MKMIDLLSKKKTGDLLAISLIGVLFILGLIRLSPFTNDLLDCIKNDPGDDWWAYARYGLDISRHGILLPSVKGLYERPSGFLYNYFIGLSFFIFGENDIPVYIIQHLLTGLAITLVFWTFRDKMKTIISNMFLAALFIFALLDVYRHYAVKLLSENLIFFLMPLFFFCFIKGFEKDRLKPQLLSAFILGLAILTRFHLAIFGIAIIILIMPFYLKRKTKGIISLLLFAVILGLTVSFLGLRNYLVCGEWKMFPGVAADPMYLINKTHSIPDSVEHSAANKSLFYEYVRQKPIRFFGHYLKNILFTFGFTSILDPSYRWRPHWMIMWLGFFAYLYLRFKNGRPVELWEKAVYLYLGCYYLVIYLFAYISNYGFRYLIPTTNFVLLFSFLSLDKIWGNLKDEAR